MRKRSKRRRIIHTVHNSNSSTQNSGINEEVKHFNWFDTSLIIGFITVLGYFVAYSFQKGYLLYFGITDIFVKQIDIVSVFISITIVGSVFFVVYTFYDHLAKLFEEFSNPYIKLFRKVFLPFLVIGLPLGAYMSSFIKGIIFITLSVILVLIYILPVIKYKDVKGYKHKIEKVLISLDEDGITFKDFMIEVRDTPSMRIVFILGAFLIIQPIMQLVGYKNAEQERDFFVLESKEQNYLVINKYGENFIIAPFNAKENTIKQEFQIIEVKSDFDSPFVYKKINLKDRIKLNETLTK
ncbi:hypothetical protein ACIQW7_11240 [Peribacillus simplex]|uniref:hypothetical protein n=1 Tax=Peribacillus simplex TaxID=1478 RepID=UPI0037F2A2A9